MCGRFNLLIPNLEELRRYVAIDDVSAAPWLPRFNIAPSQRAPVIRLAQSGRVSVDLLEWGLLPSHARDARGRRHINARHETLTQRPSFRELLTTRHSIVPATGYYEWQVVGRAKQPWLIAPPRDAPPLLTMAGLWDRWLGPDGKLVETFTVITEDARPELSAIHDRMPVLLSGADQVHAWLRGDPHALERARTTRPALATTAITQRINAPAHDDAAVLEPQTPIEPVQDAQLGLALDTPHPSRRSS